MDAERDLGAGLVESSFVNICRAGRKDRVGCVEDNDETVFSIVSFRSESVRTRNRNFASDVKSCVLVVPVKNAFGMSASGIMNRMSGLLTADTCT